VDWFLFGTDGQIYDFQRVQNLEMGVYIRGILKFIFFVYLNIEFLITHLI
jgi:hypothetical protein